MHGVLQVPLQRRLSILPCAELVPSLRPGPTGGAALPWAKAQPAPGPSSFDELTDMLYNVLDYWVLLLLAKGRPSGGPSQGGAERRAPPGRPTRMQWAPSTPRLTPPPYPNPY